MLAAFIQKAVETYDFSNVFKVKPLVSKNQRLNAALNVASGPQQARSKPVRKVELNSTFTVLLS